MVINTHEILMIIFYSIINPIGASIVKKEMSSLRSGTCVKEKVIFAITNPMLLFGVILNVLLPTVIVLYLLKSVEASTLQPLLSISYIFVLLIARFYFKESLFTQNWIGIFIILFGIYFITS